MSDKELRQAYRRLAVRLHPDRNPSDTEAATRRMVELNEAYETLADPVRRFDYNRSLDGKPQRRTSGDGSGRQQTPAEATDEQRSSGDDAAEAANGQAISTRPPPPDDPDRRARRQAKEKAAAEAAARGYRDPGAGRMNFKAPR